ncbi:MAG: hypothetical protein N2652_09090 [Kiritimatiellae bacterium]|nr:hypothetical protein [Kiritimatiellia bacterium]
MSPLLYQLSYPAAGRFMMALAVNGVNPAMMRGGDRGVRVRSARERGAARDV